MTKVFMVQQGRYRWRLQAESGTILVDDLSMASVKHAEDWARSYVSSFPSWALVIRPLGADKG